MKWQTRFTYKECKYRWLKKCINKNHNVNGYFSHNHPYISCSKIMHVASAMLLLHMQGWLCERQPFIHCGSCNVYALCQPVILPFPVYELRLPVAPCIFLRNNYSSFSAVPSTHLQLVHHPYSMHVYQRSTNSQYTLRQLHVHIPQLLYLQMLSYWQLYVHKPQLLAKQMLTYRQLHVHNKCISATNTIHVHVDLPLSCTYVQ